MLFSSQRVLNPQCSETLLETSLGDRNSGTYEEPNNVLPDEGRKRVIGIMAAILASLHMQTADDLFGGPQGSPRTDKLIAASIQWAEVIMAKIDERISA